MCTHALQWEREIERKENKTVRLELRREQEHELSESQLKEGHKSTSHFRADADNGGGYACVRAGGTLLYLCTFLLILQWTWNHSKTKWSIKKKKKAGRNLGLFFKDSILDNLDRDCTP